MSNIFYYKKLSLYATDPRKGSPHSSGTDVASAYNVVILKNKRALVQTDLPILVPCGTYGRIAPRSGIALHHSVDIAAGVIDRDYTGNVGIIVVNNGNQPFSIQRGDFIAQIICERVVEPIIREADTLITSTMRGTRGFGSSKQTPEPESSLLSFSHPSFHPSGNLRGYLGKLAGRSSRQH